MELGDMIFVGLISGLVSGVVVIVALLHFIEGYVETVREHMSQMIEDDDDIIDAHIVFEKEVMLLYRKDDHQFIAQGSSWEELNKNAIDRFPDVQFNVVTSDIEKAKNFKK